MKQHYDATVAVLTFNGEEFLEESLKAVFAQKTKKTFEVLVLDTGSKDKTLEIVKKFPSIRLHRIPNSEFSHGKTRNLVAELSLGDIVIFLTQDGVPAHEGWIDGMLEPFDISEKVACVFGKQIPRPHCFVTLKREVTQVFQSFGDDGSIAIQRNNDLVSTYGVINNFFSDVNSAVRKSALIKVPFANVAYAEDQVLGIDMLKHGYLKAYTPIGAVYHSHDYSLNKYFKRKFDEYVGLRKSTGYVAQAGVRELVLGSFKAMIRDYSFLVRDRDFGALEKVHDFFLIPFYNINLRRAIRAAANEALAERHQNKYSLEATARKQ